MEKYRLMTPGPVPMSKEAREILAQEVIHHRTSAFTEKLTECRQLLKKAFQTKQNVYCLSSTGSGAMEAAVVNCLSPKEKVLCINSGKFGQRWSEMCQTYGIEVINFELEWGKSMDLKQFKNLLNSDLQIKAVLTQACETSTGILHPIKEISEIVKDYSKDCLLMVDGITALLTTPLPMDDWKIDVLVAGSQKAFMLPTGLSFIALSENAEMKMLANPQPRYYFDLRKEKKAYEKGQTYFSSAVNLINTLNFVLKNIENIGFDIYQNKISKLAQASRNYFVNVGLKIFPENPAPALTVVSLPDNVDGKKLRNEIEQKFNMSVMGGQDQLESKVLRLGHMGDIDNQKMWEALVILNRAFREWNIGSNHDQAIAMAKNELEV